MPSRDDSIDLDQLPTMNADNKQEPVIGAEGMTTSDESEARANETFESTATKNTGAKLADNTVQHSRNFPSSSTKSSASNISLKLLWVLLVLLTVALAVLGKFSIDTQKRAADDAKRIEALEVRLSSTDESMSQSSVAMQVRLNDLKDKIDQLWGQMDKLWASAWRRNQTDLADHGTKIKATSERLNSVNILIKELETVNIQLKKEMIGLQKEADQLRKLKATVETKLSKQSQSITTVRSDVSQVNKTLENLDKRSADNARWIESINAFRKLTNKTLSELEQKLQTTPAAAATQP